MKTDSDLQFLGNCSNEDLRTLCDILTRNKHGDIRLNEQLTDTDAYLNCYPDKMVGMWKYLAHELQLYGGNTLINFCRKGCGPAYEEIVRDVCRCMKTEVDKFDSVEEMEQKLLINITGMLVEHLTEQQIRNLMEDLDIKGCDLSKQGLMALLMVALRTEFKFFVSILDKIVRILMDMLMCRGILVASTGMVYRGLAPFAGPIGWLLLSFWSLWGIAGPAYRVTVPAVIQIAFMRMKDNASK